MLRVVTYFGIINSALARKGEAPSRRGHSPGIPFPPMLSGAHLSELSIFADESGEWGCCLLLNCSRCLNESATPVRLEIA